MRDGYYQYLASELGLTNINGDTIIDVYRPSEEVKKAFEKFEQLTRLPICIDHPETFIDLQSKDAFNFGEAINPVFGTKDNYSIIDCQFNMSDEAMQEYAKGTR